MEVRVLEKSYILKSNFLEVSSRLHRVKEIQFYIEPAL